MISSKVLRHIFIPAAAVVAEKAKSASGDCVCKPSELPIYSNDTQGGKKTEICTTAEAGTIEQAFGSIRRNVFALIAEVKTLEQIGQDYLHDGLVQAEGLIDYLQEEDNVTPKYGAVAVGGLTGLIFGLRGGFFRRTVYASVGALGMAAICYPKEAAEYSQIGVVEAKRYATIAYNFVYGVKKDDPLLELPSLPKIPGSLSEAWDAAKSMGKSTSSSTVTDAQQQDKVLEDDECEESDCEIDPLGVVAEAHDEASSKSCHCPIGACMGHHEESNPVTETETTNATVAEKS